MQAKNVICFEVEKEDRIYRLQMPHGAPLGEAYEAASSFQSEMVRLINDHAEKQNPKEEARDDYPDPEKSQDEE